MPRARPTVARGSAGALVLALALLALLAARPAGALDLSGAIVSASDCSQHVLDRNDDGSTAAVPLPFTVNFFGREYDQLWVNNNGNVTFDGPLAIYTPFGLEGTQSVIIAPFFADVDTRGAASNVVRYGWGETLFQGHRAFCVDWIDVGYYNQRTDKLNSFQLLLVERTDSAPGDFDIVFNYGSILWETGDASGGIGGLGGFPARVGYSNGDGQIGSSFELEGSNRSGALLDSDPTFGLIHRSLGTTQPGRLVFGVRSGQPPPDEYVAMGDSYQSGVGAGDYDPATDIGGTNECLRSANAYPHLLVDEGVVPYRLDFVACSGARIEHLYQGGPSTSGPPWNEDAQLAHVDDGTALVTVGIGGNNLNFGPRLQDCIVKHFIFSSCESAYDAEVTDALLGLYARNAAGLNPLQQLYSDIRFRAWRGTELVLGYPRFFPLEGGSDWWTSGLFVPRCNNIRVSDQLWINHKISQLDTAIRVSAQSMGVRYVDIYDASAGHELCAGDPGFLHGVTISKVVESFHPTGYGHERIADRIEATLRSGPFGSVFTVGPGATVTTTTSIGPSSSATFSTFWPGSDVVTTLRSPSGRVISRGTSAADVYHRVGPTQELYVVDDPEPGTWTVELFGANVQPGGEQTTLDVYAAPRPNRDPQARIAIVAESGSTVTLDASGSTDPDGDPLRYLWEFADGTFAVGSHVSHTYAEPGSYRVTLVVADDRGGMGFATADHDVVASVYAFAGFFAPVANPPVVNVAAAGRAVPFKFSLGGNRGLGVLAAGFPRSERVDCVSAETVALAEEAVTPGASALSYDASTDAYTYVWKTDKAWAGQCRRFVLGLDDGSRHTADFRFK